MQASTRVRLWINDGQQLLVMIHLYVERAWIGGIGEDCAGIEIHSLLTLTWSGHVTTSWWSMCMEVRQLTWLEYTTNIQVTKSSWILSFVGEHAAACRHFHHFHGIANSSQHDDQISQSRFAQLLRAEVLILEREQMWVTSTTYSQSCSIAAHICVLEV